MKKGWQIKTLGDLCAFENGDRGENYPSKSVQTTSGVPFINAGHLTETGIDFSDMNYIPRERFDLLGNGKIQKDDILFCLRGSLGKFSCVGDLNEGAIASSLVIIRPNEQLLNPFLCAYLQSDNCADMIREFRNGAAQPNLAAASLKRFVIPVPPLAEQQRIVGILDEAFEGIATAKANAEKNLQNARALFESHLQSVFTQRGEDWVETTIESLGEIRTGKRDANHQVENGPYPFYTCAFGQFKSPTFSFEGPSIILPGNGANVGMVFFHDGKFEAYQRTYVVNKLSESINPRFLYFCFTANWPGWIATKQFGSATNYIVVGDLKAFPVPTPSLPVQKKTVEQLESFSTETQRLATIYERKLAAMDELKKSLLQQAFSGNL